MIFSEFIDAIKTKLQDQAEELKRGEIETTTVSALPQFSNDRPREQIFDITGDDGFDYDLPSDWIPGYSLIKSVEYPAGERIPTYLEDEDWIIYETASSRKLRLVNHTPGASETVRIRYTTIYLRSTVDNIPAHEQDAFANLAASLCCGLLAGRYAQLGDSTIDADAVDYQSKTSDWAQRAKELMKAYKNFIGAGDGREVKAASAVKDLDLNASNGSGRLTHPQRPLR